MKRELAIGLGALAIAAGGTYLGSATAVAATSMNDEQFVQTVQKGNDDEISLARYVLGMTKSPQVRRFANEMISDHSSANVALLKAARNAHVHVPQEERATERRTAPVALANLSEPQLDQTYMHDQVDGHQTMLDVVTGEANSPSADPALKAYAASIEPTVQKHLDMAKNIVDLAPNGDTGPNLNAPAMSGPSPVAPPLPGTAPGPVTTNAIPTSTPMATAPASGAPTPGPSHAP